MIYDRTVFTNKYQISIKITRSVSMVSHFDLVGNDSPVEDVFSYRYALFRSKNTTIECWFWTKAKPLYFVQMNKYNNTINHITNLSTSFLLYMEKRIR